MPGGIQDNQKNCKENTYTFTVNNRSGTSHDYSYNVSQILLKKRTEVVSLSMTNNSKQGIMYRRVTTDKTLVSIETVN